MLWPVPTSRRRGPCSLPQQRQHAVALTLFITVLPATAAATPAPEATTPATTPPAVSSPAVTASSTPALPTPSSSPVSAPPASPSSPPGNSPAVSSTPALPPSPPAPTSATAEAPASGPVATLPPAETTGALAGTPASKPPRVDGPYFGGTIAAGGSFVRVNNFPTPDPLSGGTASLRVGQAIYPWMTIGLELTGSWANRFADPRQRLLQGGAVIDFGFLPVPRIPLSLHVGFGAGGGAVRETGRTARSGFGGAMFTGAVRYEIFPLAARKRPRRGGGFSLGPELGWLGFTPAAAGRPMSNTIYIGLFMGFYFGS